MKKKKLIIILVVVIAALGVGGYFVYDNFLKPKDPNAVVREKLYNYSPGDYFVVNVKDSTRLTKTSLTIALKGKDITAELTEQNPLIRDTIVKVLRNYTEEEYSQPDIVDTVAEEIVKALNAALYIEDVADVYISDFVMQ